MRYTGRSLLWSIALLAGAPAMAADTPAPLADERLAANQVFRAAFDAGRYDEALPAAARVVELTANQFGTEARELVNPLTNLATTYYRLHDHGTALDTYRAALTVVEAESDAANPRLVPPLHGLGLSLAALDRGEEAIVPLKRAVDILRNREGLFTEKQLALLQPLAQAYTDAHRNDEAGSTHQYALTVAESAFGRDDPRVLPTIDNFARWNEGAGRYSLARLLHARAVQVADRGTLDGEVLAIPGLRGIARTFRLAYLFGESDESVAAATNIPVTDSLLQRAVSSPAAEGERALRSALELLATLDPDDGLARGEVLTDLGDWYLTGGSDARAVAAYREAWTSLQSAGRAELLATPAPVTYRAPSVAVSRGPEDPDRFEEQEVTLMVSVDANGDVREAAVTESVAAREGAERAVAAAVRRSRFRPAIVDGEAVARTDVPFSERVYVRIADAQ